jgi:hypothetical protein
MPAEHKKPLLKKLLQFQRDGLQQYGKYLDQQLKSSVGKKIKEPYKKYIEQQIESNGKKIRRINDKLKNL